MLGLLFFVIKGVRLIVLVDVVLSWVMPNPEQFPRNITRRITAPLYAPVHAILPPSKTGNIDLAPLIVLVLLGLLGRGAF